MVNQYPTSVLTLKLVRDVMYSLLVLFLLFDVVVPRTFEAVANTNMSLSYDRILKSTTVSRLKRRGIVLFSEGRSATLSIAKTLTSSNIGVEYCFDSKESFKNIKITRQSLSKCFVSDTDASPLMFTHIKPGHVEKLSELSYNMAIQFVDDLFQAGFDVLITNYRANVLARIISSLELFEKDLVDRAKEGDKRAEASFHTIAYESFKGKDWVSRIKSGYAIIEVAKLRAKNLGMTVVSTNFVELTEQQCNVSLRIANALLERKYVEASVVDNFVCEAKREHFSSNHLASMEKRIGFFATRTINTQLKDSPYQWMLDLSQKDWPFPQTHPCTVLNKCVETDVLESIKYGL